MDTALLGLSFDDGRIDNYTNVFPLLKKYQIPATFNITVGYVEGKIPVGELTPALPMSVDNVKEMSLDSLVEIAGHGYWHKNTIEDILLGARNLNKIVSDSTLGGVFSFASPGTNLDLDYYSQIKSQLLNNGINCVRLSSRTQTHERLRVLFRKASRVLHIPCFYKYAYEETLMDSIDDDVVYSVPVLSSTTVSELRALIKLSIKKKKACLFMFHSVVSKNEIRDNWDYDVNKFESLLECLQRESMNGNCRVLKTKDIYNILKGGECHV